MARTIAYPAGAAHATWNSLTLNLSKEFKITTDPKLFKVGSATLGEDHDSRVGDMLSMISAQPKLFGTGLAGQLAKYWPYTNPATQLGSLIYPGTNKPFVVKFKDQNILTYVAGEITKMAPLVFASDKPLLGGDVEWTMLNDDTAAVGAAGSHVVQSSAAYTEPDWDPTDEVFDRYSITFDPDGTPIVIETDKDGATFTPVVGLEAVKPAMKATTNFRVTALTALLEFRPLNMDVDDFYNTFFPAEGAGVTLGGSVRATGKGCVIEGSDTGKARLTVPLLARASAAALAANNKEPRWDRVQLQAMQTYNAGWQPLFTLDTVPEP